MTAPISRPATNPEAQEAARDLARAALTRYPNPDLDRIRTCCERACRFAEEDFGDGSVDIEELVGYFATNGNVFVPPALTLSDPGNHVDWLAARRGEIKWQFWERYQTFLQIIEKLPEPVIGSVDVRTEGILDLLEDPLRAGPWDRRGLVVGSVQSGKTGNFLGLACKALDSGYKLVIILAGIHNSLRAQTQIRMEEGLLGYNTDTSLFYAEASKKVGVGALAFPSMPVNSMTSRAESGDFKAANLGMVLHLGDTPFIVVVKKHATILENLRKWLTLKNGVERPDGSKLVMDLPMLVIDDEADHSSINTRKPGKRAVDGVPAEEVDPTRINQRIRQLLQTFDKSAYVGYTATPFANIFVDPEAHHERFGDDIFPRSFIVSLPPPDNYFSVEKVFGNDGDPDAGIDAKPGLPLTREVDDFLPGAGSKSVPEELPGTLKVAIRSFLLVCTARLARGQATKHNSMLIHVARYLQAQGKLTELVQQELLFLQRRIANESDGGATSLRDELRQLWETDFIETTRKVADPSCPEMGWAEIQPFLVAAASKIQVLQINGSSADILDYEKHRATGVSIIAVGGDKLSRGLTLEGLSVSYYMRVSKMYDSLLQMGRWFGYRPGYVDLCRIYTSQDLMDWYRHISLAESELRREFERMTAIKATPKEYGLKVRTHPDGMMVTALNKSRATQKVRVSYEGTLTQCVVLDTSKTVRKENADATEALVRRLGAPDERTGRHELGTREWSGVDAEAVCEWLDAFKSPMGTNGFDSVRIAQFIRRQQGIGELVDWTVALIGVRDGVPHQFADVRVGLVKRAKKIGGTGPHYELANSNVLNPPDQAIDLDGVALDEAWILHLLSKRAFRSEQSAERALIQKAAGRDAKEVAKELSVLRFEAAKAAGQTRAEQEAPKSPVGSVIRDLRHARRGLLLIYPLDNAEVSPGGSPFLTCALSFPTSRNAVPVEYQVNEVYRKLNLDQLEEADSDE